MLVCVYVCMFSIEIQTAGWILTKFGMEVALEGVRLLGFFALVLPTQWVRGPKRVFWVPLKALSCVLGKPL